MTSLKQEEISGATVNGKWMPRTSSSEMQAVEAGLIVQQPNGERIFYPWAKVDNVKLISRALDRSS